MPLKIVRNDITKMNTEAIVNTANDYPTVGQGCDFAVYKAAGYDELLQYRKEHIGFVEEGDAFITPGFHLKAKWIIHAVSPFYEDGNQGEEAKLRNCYRKSLALAKEHNVASIAFPLISTGGFGYPKEEGLLIAVEEIHAFLLKNKMMVYLVVFDENSTSLGKQLYPDLEAYIDKRYIDVKKEEEYGSGYYGYHGHIRRSDSVAPSFRSPNRRLSHEEMVERRRQRRIESQEQSELRRLRRIESQEQSELSYQRRIENQEQIELKHVNQERRERIREEEYRLEQLRAEQLRAGQSHSEQLGSEQFRAEQLRVEQSHSEQETGRSDYPHIDADVTDFEDNADFVGKVDIAKKIAKKANLADQADFAGNAFFVGKADSAGKADFAGKTDFADTTEDLEDEEYIAEYQREDFDELETAVSCKLEPCASAVDLGSVEKDSLSVSDENYDALIEEIEKRLDELIAHMSDTFSEYLMFLIEKKGLTNADVYKKACVNKKVFSKIKNNPDYHPNKRTALCLCVGARLNLDETKDLLSRAGYALSPCDKGDIIFSYFIERGFYQIEEIDIQLEEHGLQGLIA